MVLVVRPVTPMEPCNRFRSGGNEGANGRMVEVIDLRNTRSSNQRDSKYMGVLGTEKRAGTDTSTADGGGEGTRPVFGPRRSLIIDVDDGGCIEAHGAC